MLAAFKSECSTITFFLSEILCYDYPGNVLECKVTFATRYSLFILKYLKSRFDLVAVY